MDSDSWLAIVITALGSAGFWTFVNNIRNRSKEEAEADLTAVSAVTKSLERLDRDLEAADRRIAQLVAADLEKDDRLRRLEEVCRRLGWNGVLDD